MNDREAIKRLENCAASPYMMAAIDLAISALQEREERSKGCVYCNDVAIDIELPNANFCPMCGRPLKGEDNGKAD